MTSVYSVLLFAFLADLLMGDPYYKFHPVRLIGKWILLLERIFFKFNLATIFGGFIFWIIVTIPVIFIFSAIYLILKKYNLEILLLIFQIFTVYSSIAFKDMLKHSGMVYDALTQNDLKQARVNLQKIVGRDTDCLNGIEITRASVESISESFGDGFLSPLAVYFTGAIAGQLVGQDVNLISLIFLLIYRCSNTLDSMVGYRNEKYEKFGKFSARFDDVLNFLPSRLSILFIGPAVIFSGLNIRRAITVYFRDRIKSSSPNAGHFMSLFSGALEMKLGGGAVYSGKKMAKPWIGEELRDGQPLKIIQAMNLFLISGIFSITMVCGVLYYFIG
jgi:adenosylcobinamide-phosphate synthase